MQMIGMIVLIVVFSYKSCQEFFFKSLCQLLKKILLLEPWPHEDSALFLTLQKLKNYLHKLCISPPNVNLCLHLLEKLFSGLLML